MKINISKLLVIYFVLVGKIMICFSVPKNYERLCSANNAEDAVQLKCIQGMRFFNMICIIMAHVCMVNVLVPVANPKFNEDVRINIVIFLLIFSFIYW